MDNFSSPLQKEPGKGLPAHVYVCHEDGAVGPWQSRGPAGHSPCLQPCQALWQQPPHARCSPACMCAFVLAKSPKPLCKQHVW